MLLLLFEMHHSDNPLKLPKMPQIAFKCYVPFVALLNLVIILLVLIMINLDEIHPSNKFFYDHVTVFRLD